MTSNGDVAVVEPLDGDVEVPKVAKGGKKGRLSVERIYQKKTQLEHILLRPDTYIGSIERLTQQMWVMDREADCMVQREISFVPGLYKIYDEILVNAADNKQRDPTMSCIRIDIKPEDNMIRIWNNGKGIPVVEHKDEKMFVPTMIFGHLLTSSNYNDDERKVTGGRNGYGAKLCNIFSTKFIVETSCNEFKKALKQTWINNMTKTTEPKIYPAESSDFTCITFYPDLPKFRMDCLDEDTVALFTRRAYDLAATCQGVKIFLNGQRLPVKNFKEYVQLYLKGRTDDAGNPLKVVHEVVNPRWEVAVALSNSGFQQVSFSNSIATTKGGRHVDYISDQIAVKLMEVVKKKAGAKSAVNVKKFQVVSHLWVFLNCLIENPSFDSQTKENMTSLVKNFGSKCTLSEAFIKNTQKCGIVESILNWVRFKTMEKMQDQCHKSKRSKLKGIPKLDDANLAGTKDSSKCTLILTEGDSAKALAVAGLGVVGRDCYGVFPLRGKLLNVREASAKQVMDNVEINNMIKILGLQYKNNYKEPESLHHLRYGKIMIMTDQDQDGSHIKGLIINFLHHNWPNLIKHRFVEEFITPIVKVFKGKNEVSFYSLPEFEEWKLETPNWHTWRVKYYKGLGTSTSKEAKEYFTDMARHRILFRYSGDTDDSSINLAFGKSNADERKEWLTKWMVERKRRQDLGLSEDYLYGKETKVISYNDFINKELILFSNLDNERSIPCIVDGFKPGQRKVIFACFKRNLNREMKVAQLAGSVAEISAYHHGESSLAGTIIGLAQNFVGSNNINLLMPLGQFGTRLHGGKDAASPRYIFTCLSPLARHIFNPNDDPLLKYNFDDNLRVEPEWYIPIIPMVLVNGAEGIGTGWASKVPNFDPREIINNLKRMMRGDEMLPMLPFFRGFTGTIEEVDTCRYVVSGVLSVLSEEGSLEITELPIRVWTQNYKESTIDPMHVGSEKIPPTLSDYKEYHTDKTVRFVIRMSTEKFHAAENVGLHKYFKISNNLTTNSMVLFDANGCIRRYTSPIEIMRDFYELRLKFYEKRKQYMEGMLSAECLKLENQARFVLEKIEEKIRIENRAKRALISLLDANGYDSDPVKKWKETLSLLADIDAQDSGAKDDENETDDVLDFNYILNMPLWSLTLEKKEELLKQRDKKKLELKTLRDKTVKDLWNEDLDALLQEMDKMDELERKEEEELIKRAKMQKAKGQRGGRGDTKNEFLPSKTARRITPRISDFVMKAEAVKRKLTKKEEKAAVAAEKVFDDDDDVPPPLSERLSLGGTNVFDGLKKEAPKRQLHITTIGEPRGRGRGRGRGGGGGGGGGGGPSRKTEAAKSDNVKRSSSGSPKKKGKKKNPWETDSDNSDDDDDDFDNDVSPSRERIPRRQAAAAKKYVFEDSSNASEDDEEIFKDIDHGQGDRNIAVVSEERTARPNVIDSDSDYDDTFPPTVHKSDDSLSPIPKASTVSEAAANPRGGGAPKSRGGGTAKRGGGGTAKRGGGTGAGTRGRGRGGGGRGRGVSGKPRPKKIFGSDSSGLSSDDDAVAPAKKALLSKEPKKPIAKDPFEVNSDDDDEPSPLPLSKRLGAQRSAARVIPKYDFGDSDSESEDEIRPVKKRKRADSESDGEFVPSDIEKKKKIAGGSKAGKKGKKGSIFSDSEDDF